MIYYCDGKTFFKLFLKEPPKKIAKTQFVIVSSTIRKTGKYEKQVINANNILFPDLKLLHSYTEYKENHEFEYEYSMQLEDNAAFFASIINACLEEDMDIMFICGYKEKNYRYFKIMEKFIDDRFGFPMYDYKKLKSGKYKKYHIDVENTRKICKGVLSRAEKDRKNNMIQNEKGRKKVIKEMSKKEMQKELKKRLLYYPGMSKSEMIETLEVFLF